MTNHPTTGRQQAPAKPPARRPKVTPSPDNLRKAEHRRDALRQLLARHGLTPTQLSRLMGLSTPNLFYNFLNGISFSLSQDILERICRALPGTTVEELATPASSGPLVCMIVAEVRAGVAQDSFMLPQARQRPLPVPMGSWSHPDLFGVLVAASGAGRLYPDGTILLCRPFASERGAAPGSRVVVHRLLETGVEVTVRELTTYQAASRSFGREALPRVPDGQDRRAAVVIAGVVVASWQPEPGHRAP